MASGPISNVGSLAQALATVSQSASRPNFELAFSQMQNTVIGRLNKEIHAVNEAGGSKSEMIALQREGRKLAENIPLIEKFLFDTETNKGRLATVQDKLTSVIALFADGDISADDITSFNTQRQEIVDEMKKTWQLSYTGFTDGDIMRRLKNDVAALEALTPEVGVVDPAGTTPATNANRDVLTGLETFQNKTSTAQTVTLNSIYTVFNMREDMLSNMADIQTAVTELNSTEQLKKLSQVEALKEKYANLLHSISLSYEVSSGITEGLASRLSKPTPAVGSVLNLFT